MGHIPDVNPPSSPIMRFAVGVTGHRARHQSYPADDTALRQSVESIFDTIQALAEEEGATAPPRLITQLADGADQLAANTALERDWQFFVSLPFGRMLNRVLSAMPLELGDIEAVLAGDQVESPDVQTMLAPIMALEERAHLFEIAERDEAIINLLKQHVQHLSDATVANNFLFETAQRYSIAGRIIIEQSDLIIAIWDGQSHANIGGTGDTIRCALREAIPVLRVDPASPDDWCILTGSEMLGRELCAGDNAKRMEQLRKIIRRSLAGGSERPFEAVESERWHSRSSSRHHGYRRIETLFGADTLTTKLGSIRQEYERPEEIASGNASQTVRAIDDLAGNEDGFVDKVTRSILHRFAWTDAISARLSDRHRSGMIINFVLGSIAIIAGLLYLPLVPPEYKWPFAAIELFVLLLIVINTARARKDDLHGRWFATRRAAEYLRHRPLMLLAGVARPAGQWPHDAAEDWPERYVRHSVREVGLPVERIDTKWLRDVLQGLRDLHVVPQRNYHQGKAERLQRTHHSLDVVSEWLFFAAIIAVSGYLALVGAQYFGMLEGLEMTKIGKWLTVAGVAFPTIGGAIAGIRYFGDFERFADISEVTARRLDEVVHRIDLLQDAPPDTVHYSDVSELLRTTDQIVMSELESWQAVFSGKRISVPV